MKTTKAYDGPIDLEQLVMNLPAMSLASIARKIRIDWKKVNYAAKPYLDAMGSLQGVGDSYGLDSGKSIVLYFLSNASSWRGEVAKLIKAELNRRVK